MLSHQNALQKKTFYFSNNIVKKTYLYIQGVPKKQVDDAMKTGVLNIPASVRITPCLPDSI